MRTILPLGLFLVVASALAQGKTGLTVGADVPGTFHPFNVTVRADPAPEPEKARTPGATRHRYHCLITEYDMDPVVMIVARNLDESNGFRDLLQKLNTLVDTNQRQRLRAFVVALYPDDLTDVVTQDTKRDELAARLDRMAADLKLNGVVVTLAAPKDLVKFKLDDTAALNGIVYHKLRLSAVRDIGRDSLEKPDGPEAKALLADVAGLMTTLAPKPKK